MTRTLTIALCGGVSALAAGCATTVVTNPAQDTFFGRSEFRIMSASGGQILDDAREILLQKGAKITAERPGEAIQATIDVQGKPKPVIVYLRIGSAGRLYFMIYNLSKKEREEWREELFREIEAGPRRLPGKDRR